MESLRMESDFKYSDPSMIYHNAYPKLPLDLVSIGIGATRIIQIHAIQVKYVQHICFVDWLQDTSSTMLSRRP